MEIIPSWNHTLEKAGWGKVGAARGSPAEGHPPKMGSSPWDVIWALQIPQKRPNPPPGERESSGGIAKFCLLDSSESHNTRWGKGPAAPQDCNRAGKSNPKCPVQLRKALGRAGWIREQWDTYPHSCWNAQGEAVEGVKPHRALQENIPDQDWSQWCLKF